MKKLTVEKAQELIEQLSQGERSCREEYYLQALEAFCGWQEWNGVGEPSAQLVEVKFRNGVKDTDRTNYLYWKHNDCDSDIVAYRVVTL